MSLIQFPDSGLLNEKTSLSGVGRIDLMLRTSDLLQDYSMRDIVLALFENADQTEDVATIMPAFAAIVRDKELDNPVK